MSRARPSVRAQPGTTGFTLIELLVAAAAGGLVLAALAGLVAAHGRVARAQLERVRLAEALRVPGLVSGGELPFLLPGADVRVEAPGVLAIRALRGIGVPCADAEGLVVRYRGLRQPEPDKDSVLILAGPVERALPLSGSAAAIAQCPPGPGERLLRWTLPEPPPPGALLLLFESGSYHLEARAFRYRRGAAGRQPLTETLLDTSVGGFRLLEAPAAIEVRLEGAVDAPSSRLEGTTDAAPPRRLRARARIPFLNAPEAGGGP